MAADTAPGALLSLPYVGAVHTMARAAASHKQQCPAGSGREEEESTPWEGGEQREEEEKGFGRRKQVSGCLGLSFRAAALLDAGPAEKGRRQPQHGVARAPCCQAPSPACLNAAGPCFWPVSLPSITPPPASSSFLSSVLVLMRSLEEVSLENEAGLCEPKEPDVSQQQSSKPTHSHFRSLSEASHLLAQLLLCCFPPSARKTSFCASFPPSGLSTEGFFFAVPPVLRCGRVQGSTERKEEGLCRKWQRLGKGTGAAFMGGVPYLYVW